MTKPLWCVFVALAVFAGQLQAQQQEYEDPTGKVFQSLADITVNRDQINQRFAMLAIGETHVVLDEGAPEIQRRFWIRASDRSQHFDYWANCFVNHQNQQFWYEWARTAGRIKNRMGDGQDEHTPYKQKEVGVTELEFMQISIGAFNFFDPLEDLFAPTGINQLFRRKPFVETDLIAVGELKSAVLIGGKLVTKWQSGPNLKVSMTQDQSVDLMPITIERKAPFDDSVCHIKWKKDGKVWLPVSIRSYCDKGPMTESNFIQMQWKIGADAQKVDVKAQDLRLISEQFDFKVDKLKGDRYFFGTRFVTPPELFGDDDKLKK
ncbi:MAG: hypothetical protein WBD20_17390 [Pirellulaceae bacterium]